MGIEVFALNKNNLKMFPYIIRAQICTKLQMVAFNRVKAICISLLTKIDLFVYEEPEDKMIRDPFFYGEYIEFT